MGESSYQDGVLDALAILQHRVTLETHYAKHHEKNGAFRKRDLAKHAAAVAAMDAKAIQRLLNKEQRDEN